MRTLCLVFSLGGECVNTAACIYALNSDFEMAADLTAQNPRLSNFLHNLSCQARLQR